MKKLFGLIVLCALTLLCASCQEDITAEIDANEVKVSFSVKTDVLQTKAIADASNIDILHWEIYPEDIENAAAPLMKSFVRKQEGQDEFHLELTLVSQQKYNFVFWAQVEREEGKEHYDISDLRNVRIKSYKDELANDESRAAFFAYRTFDLTNPLKETVVLKRPFSQLNFGTETYDVSSLNLSQALKVEYSQVTVAGLGKSFNTIEGIGQGDTTVTFAKAPTPNGDIDALEQKLVVNDIPYYWLGMNYLIVNGESDNVNVDVIFHTNHGDVSLGVDNVPVKENYRTNIIGNLLTTEATFKIVVDERFRQPDIIVGDEGNEGGEGDEGDEGGSELPSKDFYITEDGDDLIYTVYTFEGLEAWRQAALQNALDKKSDMVNLLLAADIELPEVEEGNSNWTPLGTTSNPYNGFVDGGGYTISNLTIVGTDNVGFIGVASIDDAVAVKNLKLANVKISGNKNVAAIVGQVTNDGEVENCHVLSGAVVGTGNYVAGILGYTDVYGCVYNSSNAADISGASYVGGVSGRARATSCENRGNITGTGSNVGGVYGLYTYGSTSYNNNYGKVSGHNNVGGIAGNGSSSYSYNEGDVVGNDYVAGIVASLSTNISELGASVNKGNVKGRNYVAGILAESKHSIGDCTNEGRIEGRMYVAGIVAKWHSRTGYSNNILARCENKGDVTGISYVSGLVSYLTGTHNCNIINNTNNASVTGEDKVAAFLAYNENSNVINNTNTGDITGYFDVAHFVAAFNKSYSPDTVTGNVSTGELRILQNNDYKRICDINSVSYVAYTQKGFEAWASEARQCVEDGYACNLTLETDVVLAVPSSDESNWTPLGTENKKFKGDIDARNHCIYNLTIKDSRDGMGFIGYISSGSIKNLKLANVNIVQSTTNNYNYVGAVAAYSTVAIENCHVLSGTIIGLDDWVGGISGYCEKTITNCTNYASITGAELGYSTNGYVGGIVGEGKVAQCENFGNVTGYMRYTGGCTGEGNASECKNHGDVTQCGKNRYVGGISGYGTVEQSENKGTVSGYSYVGGLTGRGNVTDSVNSGDVIGTDSNIGEYTGNGTAQGCTNTGTVTGAN